MRVYYVVMLGGVPVDVTSVHSRALTSVRELSTSREEAIIVPCIPTEDVELDEFIDEEPTIKEYIGF